jgi:transposase-like protein
MKFKDFFEMFPNEEACRLKIKEIREKEGVVCKKCNCKEHYWKNDKQLWQCKECSFRTTLRSGTVMENSKLPFRYWLTAMQFLTHNKKSYSAKSIQNELGHKRYEPIWTMLHKLRAVMGYRDSEYELSNWIELDEGFFEHVKTKDQENKTNGGKNKRGRGSEKQAKVIVAIESDPTKATKLENPHNKKRKAGYLKMIVVDDLEADTIDFEVKHAISKDATVETDGYKSYNGLNQLVKRHIVQKSLPKDEVSKVFPWVHTAISNSKKLLLGVWHRIDDKYLQNYLNEYCYRYNRRYFGDKVFDRLLVTAVSYTSYGHRSG